MSEVHLPWTAEHVFHMAQLAIAGMKRQHQVEPAFLSIHPEDWELCVKFGREKFGKGPGVQPRLRMYGYKVRLDEKTARGDVVACFEV